MKLKPKNNLNLSEIHRLFLIFRKSLERDHSYPVMAEMLYNKDHTKFQEAFKIMYGKEFPDMKEKFVARILLQSGLQKSGLLDYYQVVRSSDG